MKLAIVGSRNIEAFDLASVVPAGVTCIVSGGAIGIDTIAKEYAHTHDIEIIEHLPEYDKYGRTAPIIRNKKIVQDADKLLAVWDGKSRGTAFTIAHAKKVGKEVIVVKL